MSNQEKQLRLFNLDLHISVIADFRTIIETLFPGKIELTEWSLSNHSVVFGKQRTNVNIINHRTWFDINDKMITDFQELYGDFLETFDAFVVTHSPVFCRIYEPYKKPIILINSCRYEQPYCWSGDIHQWLELNACLKRLEAQGLLFPVSNNKADMEYLRLGADLDSYHIPSLCSYIGIDWSPEKAKDPTAIVYSNEEVCPPMRDVSLRSELPKPFSWSELFLRKAIVHVPYEISTMSIAEQYTAGVPLFFPSKKFLHTLWVSNTIDFQGPYAREVPIPTGLQIPLDSPDAHMWWLNRADFYDLENMKYLYYYDSWEDLEAKLENFRDTTFEARKAWLLERKAMILTTWKGILERAFPILKN